MRFKVVFLADLVANDAAEAEHCADGGCGRLDEAVGFSNVRAHVVPMVAEQPHREIAGSELDAALRAAIDRVKRGQ